MPRYVCCVCKDNLPVEDDRPTRWMCAACQAVLKRMSVAHGDERRLTPPDQEERIERYAAIIAAGGRLFE